MRKLNWSMMALLLFPAVIYAAGAPDDAQGWWFSERFVGTSNDAGIVLKSNSTIGYHFTDHVQVYGGLPVYLTRQSPSAGTAGGAQFVNGVGNAFTGLLVSAHGESLRYSSDLVVTAPTGDQARGFSTGHVTVDWTNTFSHPFTRFTPYGSAGLANTISDTEFFVRPFTTKGAVVHAEGGSLWKLASHLNAGASIYSVRAAGAQEIVSKVVEIPQANPSTSSQKAGTLSPVTTAVGSLTGNGNSTGNSNKTVFETTHQTVTTSDAVDDHGFSTWLSLRANEMTDFQIGYSRSVAYQFNSLFFGIGFRAGH